MCLANARKYVPFGPLVYNIGIAEKSLTTKFVRMTTRLTHMSANIKELLGGWVSNGQWQTH